MEQILSELKKISAELADIKMQLADLKMQLAEYETARYFENWIPRKKLMQFFDYGATQIAAMFKNGGLLVSDVDNRKFIKKDSVLKLLEENVKKYE